MFPAFIFSHLMHPVWRHGAMNAVGVCVIIYRYCFVPFILQSY